jgi:menaquinone-dependent protoporphyrinogen oxidase
MARILVIFGTSEGQTAKIAHALAVAMREQGADVDVANAAARTAPPDPYAGVVVAASVHAGGYQRAVRRWVRAHAAALHARETAFVSVCLGVLEHNPETDRELQKIQERFRIATGWLPGVTKTVAGIRAQAVGRDAPGAGGPVRKISSTDAGNSTLSSTEVTPESTASSEG